MKSSCSEYKIIDAEDLLGHEFDYANNLYNDLYKLINLNLLEKKHPQVFKKLPKNYCPKDINDLLYDLKDSESVFDVMNNIPIIKLTLKNKDQHFISFIDFLKNIPQQSLDCEIYHVSLLEHFLIITTEVVIGQAGSLAIWDAKKSSFTFFFESVNFCINDKIHYSKEKDEFYSTFYYSYPLSYIQGEGNFVITDKRKLKTKQYYYTDSRNIKYDGIGKFFENED